MSIAQTAIGYWQYAKGKKQQEKLDAEGRPQYEIPEEFKQNLSQAQLQALEGMPAEQKQQYIENVQRATQSGLGATSTRKGGLSGIGTLYQQETDAYRQLLSMDSQARQQNQQQVMQARSVVGEQQLAAQEVNVFQPYRLAYNQAQALMGAGAQNVVGGWQGTRDVIAGSFTGGAAGGGGGGGQQNPTGTPPPTYR